MKHTGLHILLASLVLVGCSDQYSDELGLIPTLTPRYLKVSSTSLSFSAAPTTGESVSVETVQTPWKIENTADWITVSPVSGKTDVSVGVSVSENTDADVKRVGVFYVKSDVSDWSYEKGVSVSQSSATPYINVSRSSITMTGAAGTSGFTVAANGSYSVSCSADWLTTTQQGDSVVISATANESTQYRTATITLLHDVYNKTSSTVTVTQAPASITASTETLVFENTAGELAVSVTAEADWTVSTSYSWISVSPSSGNAGTSSFTVSVSPNTSISERTGYVVLVVGNNSRIQIPVRQRGIYIETDKSQYEFEASVGTQTVQIQSNTSWLVSSVPSWVTVDKTSGTGKAEIKVSVEDNPNTTERNGEFTISQPEQGTVSTVVKIYQKGKTFELAAATLAFDDKAGTQTVSVSTDGTWNASTQSDWIKVSPASATGSGTLSISVAENTAEGERNGVVSVVMGNATATVAVVQNGKYFTVDNSLLDFTSKGGALDVYLTTNAQWTARIGDDADWLSVSPTSGSDSASVRIVATDNASMQSRSATVYFDALGRSVNVIVKQKARYLTLNVSELLFYAKGGVSDMVTISTDGTYAVSCTDSWLTVTRSGDSFTVTASVNDTEDVRNGKVTISLTDLEEDTYSVTLPVTQLPQGGSFTVKDFDDDVDYDSGNTTTVNLTITDFGKDKNYDSGIQNSVTLSVTGYKDDVNWDITTQ